MCFIGIITDEKSKKYINKIDKEQFKDCTFKIVYITDNNIENMKHIRFDTIVINKKINNIDVLRDILKSAKYIIINSDLNINLNILKEYNCLVITYGFNSKSTITMSSNTLDSVQICIQRSIQNKKSKIEQQEISLIKENQVDTYDIMLLIAILLIYNNEIIALLKL